MVKHYNRQRLIGNWCATLLCGMPIRNKKSIDSMVKGPTTRARPPHGTFWPDKNWSLEIWRWNSNDQSYLIAVCLYPTIAHILKSIDRHLMILKSRICHFFPQDWYCGSTYDAAETNNPNHIVLACLLKSSCMKTDPGLECDELPNIRVCSSDRLLHHVVIVGENCQWSWRAPDTV